MKFLLLSKFSVFSGAVGAAILLAAAPVVAAIPSPDQAFAASAAQGGMAEVQAAQLALKKSQNPEVVTFAHRMITDHGKANVQLSSIMKAQGVAPPTTIDPMDKAMASKLSSLSGTAFDEAYLKGQLAAHKKTIALFQKEVTTGADAQLVAFAKQTLPTLEMHLSMVTKDVASM